VLQNASVQESLYDRPSAQKGSDRSRFAILRLPVAAVVAVCVSVSVPRFSIGRNASALVRGDLTEVVPRADRVAFEIMRGVSTDTFHTGSPRFDGEWTFGTNQMAILGLTQIVLAHDNRPDLAKRWLPAIRKATATLMAPATRAFATQAWGDDAMEHLTDGSNRDAWLGYVALSLGMSKKADPMFAYDREYDAIVAALRMRVERSNNGLFETYPGETYPVDVSSAVAAISLYDSLHGKDASLFVTTWSDLIRTRFIDSRSGYLGQTASNGEAGIPRGSGTALAAYFLGFTKSALARELFDALKQHGDQVTFGFSTIREYPSNALGGTGGGGDIDSGPVIFGASVSATGFTLGSARRFGDVALFTRLHRTAELFGMPYSTNKTNGYAVGGPLGDAILLAMETAAPIK
jgi:hypothetical protein